MPTSDETIEFEKTMNALIISAPALQSDPTCILSFKGSVAMQQRRQQKFSICAFTEPAVHHKEPKNSHL